MLNRMKNRDGLTYKSQETKSEGIFKYTVSITYHKANFQYIDYYTFYIASWENWDTFVNKIENNALYRAYNNTTFTVLKSTFSLLLGTYFAVAGVLMSVAGMVTSIVSGNICIFAKCSRATLNAYKENKKTDNMFIYIATINTDIFMKNGLGQQSYGSSETYRDDGINKAVI